MSSKHLSLEERWYQLGQSIVNLWLQLFRKLRQMFGLFIVLPGIEISMGWLIVKILLILAIASWLVPLLHIVLFPDFEKDSNSSSA